MRGGEKGARERAKENERRDTAVRGSTAKPQTRGGARRGMREVQERCDPAVCSGSRERRTLPRARARARASASLQNNASEH